MSDFSCGLLIGAASTGRDFEALLEMPAGLMVDDETIELAAKMATVARVRYDNLEHFSRDLLHVMKTAREDGDDPIAAIDAWVDANLADLQLM